MVFLVVVGTLAKVSTGNKIDAIQTYQTLLLVFDIPYYESILKISLDMFV